MSNTDVNGNSTNSFVNCDPNKTVGSVLQVANNNTGIDGTLRNIYDANGNSAPLQISTSQVNVTNFNYNGHAVSFGGALTFSGAFSVTLTSTGTTSLTLPALTDTLVSRTSTDTLTNKTLTSPVITSPVISTIVNTGTLTLPTSTDTLVGRATTDTLTNKTYDTAGVGNVLKINGTQVSTVTGTGSVVLNTSPTLVTPVLGTPASGTLTNCTGLPVSTVILPASTWPIYSVSVTGTVSASSTLTFSGAATFDTASAYTSATGKFQPTVSGYYNIKANVDIPCRSGATMELLIQKNGVTIYAIGFAGNGAATGTGGGVSGVVQLNGSTDYITVILSSHDSGGSNTIISASMSGNRVG